MSMTEWPFGVTHKPLPGMKSAPQRNVVSFRPEIGPSIDRRRGSSKVQNATVSFDLTSFTDCDTFKQWFEADLLDGTQPFLWEDPTEPGMLYQWKFAADDAPYEFTYDRGTYATLTCKLVRIAKWVA